MGTGSGACLREADVLLLLGGGGEALGLVCSEQRACDSAHHSFLEPVVVVIFRVDPRVDRERVRRYGAHVVPPVLRDEEGFAGKPWHFHAGDGARRQGAGDGTADPDALAAILDKHNKKHVRVCPQARRAHL